ncbi:cTAGE family member 5 isoform X1 [Syngnathoides biaculeatus]|uniref:cTAGE family member 5 isoform X1 n=1 Tax=Syngnathoides biaculeatus TaxID=300417 RepID=UPI002ADE76E7|nr:cTAGE family member 5 isoform X1 [Syngnathoides biaculeatus]
MTHENLSEQDKEKHLHENTPSQDTKNMESPYLQGTVTSVINFLKESSFVSYLGPESEDNEYKEEEHKELGEGEEQNEIMKMEEQEDSQVLTEKWKETVRRQRKKQQDLISREKQKPLEELKFKTPEHLTEVERVYYRKHGEFIEKTKEEDVALKDTKEGITELIQKEQIETFDNEKHKEFKQVDKQEEMQMLDHKHEVVGASVMKIQNKLFALDDLEWDMSEERDKLTNIVIDEMDGKLGNFTQKEEADEFEDEKQEGFERGKRGEVVIVLGEKTQEVVEGLNEEKLEDFVDKQEEVGELEETKYQVSGESEEAFEGERQEELEPKEQVGQRFEKTHKGDSESSGLLEDKGQEDFKDREWKEVQKLEKYEVDSKPREELEEKENMEEIKVKQQSKVGKLEKRYEMRSESGDGMEQKKHEEVEMLKYDEDGESEGLEEKDNMEINVNQNEVGKLEKKYEVSGEPGEELQEKSLQMKHKKQEEVEKLEKYEVDGESVENLEEEHIYVKQEEVEKLEKKYEVSGESREELDHKGKEKFKDRDLEKLEKLEKYDVNVESIERFENKMQENFTDKEQEGVEKLDKVEKDYDSGEDLQEKEKMEAVKIKKEKEARDSEEPNQFEPRKREDLYKGLNRTEVEEKRKGGVRKWKHVELVQIKEEETQEFNRDLKVSEDINVSEFVERRDVKEVIESVECMDKLCTQIDQNEVITERGEHSFEDDSNKVTKGSGGIFGLFNKVISLDQRPINKMKELTNSHAAFAGKANEMLKEKPFQTPKEELDATTNNDKDLQENFLPPSPSLTQNSQSSFLLSNTAKTHQPKPLPNNYKILQDYVGREEATILVELFGAKKLKLLDYILGHPDVFTEDVDESIVLDTETLLHYCREELFTASIQLSDAPDDKENTRTIFAIQKVQILLKRARETFNARKSAINRANSQARPSYVDASCPACSKDQETARVMVGKQKDGGPEKNEKNTGRCEEISLVEKANKLSHSQTVPSELLEGVMLQPDVIHHIQEQSSSQTHAMKDFLKWLKLQVVSSLPDDIRPGPDLYGIPWEPIVISSLLGLVVVLLFSCRCYSAVKSRMYRRKEWWMAEQVAQLVEEKCEVLATLSKCQQEYDKLENLLSDSDVSDETHKTRDLEVRARHLDLAKTQLEENLQELKDQLDQQRAHRIEQEKKITLLAESMQAMEEETKELQSQEQQDKPQSMQAMEEETKELQSQEQQAQTTIKVYNMNTDRLQRNLETTEEENSLLKESSKHLRQQMEGWSERVSELEEEMRRYEMAHSGMVQDVANKDERIMSLTNRLLGMKAWDADLECDGGESSKETTARAERNGKIDLTNSEGHLQKVQKLVYAAKLNADLKSIDEDKDRVFAKLNDEVKAKEDLEVSIKELENERLSMQADTEHYSEQVQRLQQKLQIMTEMYQENELKLHRLLTVEEKERLQKEDKLNKADKNIALAMEELNNYKLRAGEMEEELEKTKQSYQTQISAHEKKAHNNWLAARAADRELSDIKRENALLRQKLTDTQFKLDALDKDPFALDSLARPLPFRAERLPYGPSPLGHPASENRASLSPPTLLDGPLSRLSPRGRAPIEPPTAQGELERSGGPHSDSGSISPSWERDRRGPPPGGPGPFPPQGGPVYRRPGPPPGVMGPLLPPGPPFPHPRSLPNSGPQGPMYPVDSTDGVQRENSFGPEQAPREPGPGDRRTPPESALRMVLPPMGPIDAPFPRRAPFRPPDFFPSRGPGGPPMMPMWAPRPGMMLPPRYPPGGPPPPHLLSYGPLMRPPPPNDLAPTSMGPPTSQQNLPSVPHSQSQDEQMSFP